MSALIIVLAGIICSAFELLPCGRSLIFVLHLILAFYEIRAYRISSKKRTLRMNQKMCNFMRDCFGDLIEVLLASATIYQSSTSKL